MRDLILLRKMLRVLHWEFNLKNPPSSQTRAQFVKYYTDNKRGRFIYRDKSSDDYKAKIYRILGQEMPNWDRWNKKEIPDEELKKYFLDYHPGTECIVVSHAGETFIDWGGLVQVMGERLPKMWVSISWLVLLLLTIANLIVAIFKP